MTDRSQHNARWVPYVSAMLATIGFAGFIIWAARRWGRTFEFAFAINWVLIAWAIWVSHILESRPGAWDGINIRLPASWYAIRPFEKSGRFYDCLGIRWYRRFLRSILWSVKPALLRSERDARQKMIRDTHGPEAGHLVIFVVIFGITLWALARRWWDAVAWLLLFNVLHNAYPVLSLRQIRYRLQRRDIAS